TGQRSRSEAGLMRVVAGVDLGGTAVNYTLVGEDGKFLIEGLCEYPARAKEGPAICLQQIADGLAVTLERTGIEAKDVAVVGLDSPGPTSAAGVFSARGSTNFVHADWTFFDLPKSLSTRLGRP